MDLQKARYPVRLGEQRLKLNDDPFLAGPLAHSRYSSKAARERYVQETYGTLGSRDDSSHEDLLGDVLLTHSGEGYLFDYQQELVNLIIETATAKSEQNIGLVSLPTGAGKTRVAMWALLQLFTERRIHRALWIAPTIELLAQARDTLIDLWPHFLAIPSIQIRFSTTKLRSTKSDPPQIRFATPQLLASRVKRQSREFNDFDVLIFDEAHQVSAPIFCRAVTLVRQNSHERTALIGLTATPGRADVNELDNLISVFRGRLLISHILGPHPVNTLRERGILAELCFKTIPLGKGWPGLVMSGENWGRTTIRRLEKNVVRFDAVIRTIEDIAYKQRSLVFAGSIAHANAINAVLLENSVSSAVLTSRTPLPRRRRIIDAFANAELQVIVNKTILATGYDCPSVANVVLSVPIGSPILFEQIVGRVSRGPAVGGNKTGTVWQIDDHLRIHGLPSSYYRYRDYDWQVTRRRD